MKTSTYFLTGAFLAFGALLLLSCDPSVLLGPQAGSANAKNIRASYYSGPCYGRCEVFTLELYDNGLLLYKGERFTERPGVWQKNIDRRRMTGLLDSFARADFKNYPLTFQSQIPDAPTIKLTWYDEQQEAYTTAFKEYAPPELEQLSLQMRRLAALPDWRPVSADIPESGATPVANMAREEIIVQLNNGVNAAAWVVNYGKQNVQLVNRLSPNSAYYLITADPNLMPAKELLDFLRKDPEVTSAQLNNKAEERQ